MPASEHTYGAVVTDDAVGDVTVGADAGVTANEDVLLHLAAVAQADPRASVDIVARVCAASSFLVCEVRLGGEGVNPPPHEVRRYRVIHKQIGHSDTVPVPGDVHVYLVARDLNRKKKTVI